MSQEATGIRISAEGESPENHDSYHDYQYEVITYKKKSWDGKMYFDSTTKDNINRDVDLVKNPDH